MKTIKEFRRSYQVWRMLDHIFGKNLPATRYISKRDRVLELFLSKNEISENNIRQVDRVKDISEKKLKQNYIAKGIPVVIEGKAKDWKCVKQWTLDWLSDNYSKDQVAIFDPLNSENDKINYKVEKTTIKEVIESIKLGDTNKYSRFNRILYDHPELIDDFDWKWLYKMRNIISSGKTFQVFIGGKGSKTSLHCATENNLFTQVYGEKHWYLYPPKNDIFLTPPITKSPYFYSDFNPDNPDFKKFPTARFLSTYECVLRPGDILYNPPLWWHQVKNLSHSIGVGFRWFNPLNSFKASFVGTLMTLLSTNPPIWTATKYRTDFARIFKYMNTKSNLNG
tara:strand:- start:308 stop:1318 length:1011 start_codon:yes stop_codon:yes gene_type:complete